MIPSEREKLGIGAFEERRGASGVWRFVELTNGASGRVVKALSEWGQTYEFSIPNWMALPKV